MKLFGTRGALFNKAICLINGCLINGLQCSSSIPFRKPHDQSKRYFPGSRKNLVHCLMHEICYILSSISKNFRQNSSVWPSQRSQR